MTEEVNLWGFLLFIVGLTMGTMNMMMRLKKLPGGMYNIEAYLNSIMSVNFWIIMVLSIIIATIGVILSREK